MKEPCKTATFFDEEHFSCKKYIIFAECVFAVRKYTEPPIAVKVEA